MYYQEEEEKRDNIKFYNWIYRYMHIYIIGTLKCLDMMYTSYKKYKIIGEVEHR